ncbi:MAG: sensor histidine kinase [Bryobacteraceae bacterium]
MTNPTALDARRAAGGAVAAVTSTVSFWKAAWGRASRIHGYLPALAALALAMALHSICLYVFGNNSAAIFFVYLTAILIAAWCGYGPGLLVVALVAAVVPFLFIPTFSLAKINRGGVTVLVVVSLMVSRTAQSRKQTEALLRASNDELDQRVRLQTAKLEAVNTALQHQLAELEGLYGKMVVGLCFLDANLRFVRVNEALAALNGVPVAAHLGRELREILTPSLNHLLEPLYRRVLETGEPLLDYDLHSPAPADPAVERDWMIGCAPVRTDDGTLLGLQITVQDITERKRAEKALNDANVGLRQANGDLEQFAYSASHDLSEPLRMVSIYSQILQRRFGGKLGSQGEQYIEFVTQGAQRMEQLVRDLLAYTRTSMTLASTASADSSEALDRALANLQLSIAQSAASISRGPLPPVRMQMVQLEQIFQNLIGNALKYRSEEPPQIAISATQRDGEWLFLVNDNGIGIDPQYKEQIFGVFKRLHTASEYAGTGIGLALCQRIVERHGGRIWVESEIGKGATFFFTVPDAG